MNWEHFKAIVWLRWRLTRNQWRRAGMVNSVLMIIFFISMLIVAVSSFFVALVVGAMLLPKASPLHILIAWDALIAIFLFAWTLALLIEIQRSEMLSLDKMLQLPVSLKSAFAMNYCTSLVSLTVVSFFSTAIGFSFACVITYGPRMLLQVGLVGSFLFMVTALTYQLRGWLASLMSNKRRQRSVIAGITLGFVALSQLPNIFIQLMLSGANQSRVAQQEQLNQLSLKLAGREVTIDEHNQQVKELNEKFTQLRQEESANRINFAEKYLTIANQIIPLGWLPYGGKALVNGQIAPATLGLLGMASIGLISLWRGYLATLRYYTGVRTWRWRVVEGSPRLVKPLGGASKLERKLPWLSEPSSAVALCSFYNFTRAPEAKMMLIAPLVFGGMVIMLMITKKMPTLPVGTEAYLMLGGLGIEMFIVMTLLSNSFGYDRSGFRSYVLMPTDRSEILIGKNASVMPVVFALAAFALATTSFLAPVRISDFLASVLQIVMAFLAACLIGNFVSIYFPMVMAGGTGKPAQPNIKTVLAQMLAMTIVPLVLVPGAIAISLELAMSKYLHVQYLPLYLILSVFEAIAMLWLYRKLIGEQGKLLAIRETHILQLLGAHLE